MPPEKTNTSAAGIIEKEQNEWILVKHSLSGSIPVFFFCFFFTTSLSKSHSVNYRKTSPSTGILRLWEEVVASTTSSPPFTSGSHELNSQSAGVEAEEKTDVKRMQFTNWETTKTTDKLRKKTPRVQFR